MLLPAGKLAITLWDTSVRLRLSCFHRSGCSFSFVPAVIAVVSSSLFLPVVAAVGAINVVVAMVVLALVVL